MLVLEDENSKMQFTLCSFQVAAIWRILKCSWVWAFSVCCPSPVLFIIKAPYQAKIMSFFLKEIGTWVIQISLETCLMSSWHSLKCLVYSSGEGLWEWDSGPCADEACALHWCPPSPQELWGQREVATGTDTDSVTLTRLPASGFL